MRAHGSADHLFHATYARHREQFIMACRDAQLSVASIEHPSSGPEGEPLAVDVARFGPTNPSGLLIIVSGTHGIEGFCGSAIQAELLRSRLYRELPSNVGLLLIHALNPYGFAWMRRTDADNIDLNRNFLDFRGGLRANPAYEEIHGALVPTDWDGAARASADEQLRVYIEARGMRALQSAVFGGQYAHPEGLVYGGRAPAWSNLVWRRLLSEHARDAQFVAVLDVHSGLGEPGACELISGARAGTTEFDAAHAWFGSGIVFPGGTSTAPAASGYMGDSLASTLPRVIGSLVVAEFGTVAIDSIFKILRADNWIHARERQDSAIWRSTKADMYEAFVRPDAQWKSAIVDQGVGLTRRIAAALEAATSADFAT